MVNGLQLQRPQRILMTADTLGGVWTYAIELCRALGQENIEIVLATLGAPLTAYQRQEVHSLASVILQTSRYKLEWMDQPWDDVAAAGKWLLGLEATFRPDVVHLNQFSHGALAWQAPCLVVGHSCVLSWWQAVKGESAPDEWQHYRHYVARGLRAADTVVAPSWAMMRELEIHYGPLRGCQVIANGRELNVPFVPKEAFVLAAGRLWDDAKNIRALATVAPKLPWPVYVAGNREHPNGGTTSLTNLHLLGQLAPSKLAQWYARAAIYALPARYEPFGLTPLEAAGARCALVLGDIPSLRENWEGAATFVPPNDPDALSRALLDLINDPSRCRELADQAESRRRRFTPATMAGAYLTAYGQLMAQRVPATVELDMIA